MNNKSSYFKEHPYILYKSLENSPFPFPTNSLGLVGKKEYAKRKTKGVRRILIIGGSTVEGLPPKNENPTNNPNLTWSHLLEARLNKYIKEIGSKIKYEVLNLSSSGYTSYECLLSYICKGIYLEPDLIISYQGVNDVIWSILSKDYVEDYSHARVNNFHRNYSLIENLFYLLPEMQLTTFLDRFLSLINIKKPKGLIYSISKENQKIDLNYDPNKLNTFINNIGAINAITKIHSSKLLNFTFVWDESRPPNPVHIFNELKRNDYKEIFQEYYNRYLTEMNKLLSMKNDFSTYCLPKEEFIGSCFYDGMHFNLKGMNKISELATNYIISNEENLFKL